MGQMRIALDWAFAASLEGNQSQLIAALKPDVTKWVNATLPAMQKRLRRAHNGTQSVMLTRMVNIENVWMFNAMIHNRDIGTDTIAMVAPSEDMASIMAQSFLEAAEARMGPSR